MAALSTRKLTNVLEATEHSAANKGLDDFILPHAIYTRDISVY